MPTTTLASSNLIQLRYAFEATPGVAPAVPYQNLRISSQSLQHKLTYTQSNELRADRQVIDHIQTDQTAQGSIGVELSYGSYDDFMAASLQGNWSQPIAISGTDLSVGSNNRLLAGIVGRFVSFPLGAMLRISGFNNPRNNGDQIVTAVANLTDITLSGGSMISESAGATVTVQLIGFAATNDFSISTSNNGASGLTSVTVDFTALGLTVGQWITLSGFANAANNGLARIANIATRFLTLDNTTLVAESRTYGQLVIAKTSSFVRNGVNMASLSLERHHTDVNQFFLFSGMALEEMQLTLKTGQILTGSFKFHGMRAGIRQSTASSGPARPAPQTPVLNAIGNVIKLNEGGQAPTGAIKSLSLQVQNALRGQKAVGALGSIGIGNGTISVTLTLEAYFRDQSLYTKYLNDAQTSFACALRDPAGNIYVLTIPAAKLDNCQIQGEAINQDVSLNLTARAKLDPVTNCMIQIDRISA